MKAIDCKRCGSCCIEPIIPVNDDEVRRLMKATGLPARKVTRFFSFDEVEWPWESEDWVELGPGRRLMALRKINDRCMFLTKDGCSVYNVRPRVCRIFPVDFFFNEEDLDDFDVEIQQRIKKCQAVVIKRPEKHKGLVAIGRALFRADQSYQKKVFRWNRSTPRGTITQFLKYLKLA